MAVRNQIPGRPWVPGIVEEVQGPLTYLVRLDTGQIWKRHIDHVREVGVSNDEQTSTTDTEVFDVLIPTDNSSTNDTPSMPESASEDSRGIASSSTSTNVDSSLSISTNVDSSSPSDIPQRRYPQRTRKPNPRYTYIHT